jgi:hypothetical protein
MGMDSAVRKFVKEMRDIVADEVRAQVAGQNLASLSASEPAIPVRMTSPDAGAPAPTPVQRANGEHLVPRAPSDPAQPIFDAAEAAWFLRYSTMKAFYQAVHRYGIPHARRGARVMLFRRADLEKFLASRTRDH